MDIKEHKKQEMFSDIMIDDDQFDHDTKCIKAAYYYINMYANPMDAQIDQDSEIEFDISNNEFEEFFNEVSNENDEELSIDQTRLKLIKNSRQPLRDFPENFNELNDAFKKLIEEHKDELFSKEYYQEQIYFVLSLTENKKNRQIAKLFGIHPATVNTHSKRMLRI